MRSVHLNTGDALPAVALWIRAGENVLEVKRRAGHTRSTFTLDRYGHLFPDADDGLAGPAGMALRAAREVGTWRVRKDVLVTSRVQTLSRPRPDETRTHKALIRFVDPTGIEPVPPTVQT